MILSVQAGYANKKLGPFQNMKKDQCYLLEDFSQLRNSTGSQSFLSYYYQYEDDLNVMLSYDDFSTSLYLSDCYDEKLHDGSYSDSLIELYINGELDSDD